MAQVSILILALIATLILVLIATLILALIATLILILALVAALILTLTILTLIVDAGQLIGPPSILSIPGVCPNVLTAPTPAQAMPVAL